MFEYLRSKVTPPAKGDNNSNPTAPAARPGPRPEPVHQPIPPPPRDRTDAEVAASFERDGKARSWDDAAAITRACHLALTALQQRHDCNGELTLRLYRLCDELWRASANFRDQAREIRYPNGEARP